MKKHILSLSILFLVSYAWTMGIQEKSFADHFEFMGPVVEEPGYFLWGSSPILDDEGRVHLFIARWKIEKSFDNGWRSDSEVAHYVGKTPQGPFVFSDVVLKGTGEETWDKYGIHNPTIHKVNDQYVLLFIANNEWRKPMHGPNQRIGMATSKSLYGPWEKVGKDGLILAPSDDPNNWSYQSNCGVNNPAFVQLPDGSFNLYFKAQGGIMGVAKSKNLEGPYEIYPKPVTQNEEAIEDGYAFLLNDKICLLTTDNHGIIEKGGGILWSSDDGIHFNHKEQGFKPLKDYLTFKQRKACRFNYGYQIKFERPQLLLIDGKPAWLYLPSGANMYGRPETMVHLLKYVE